MEGTVTISTEEYRMLLQMARAINKRQVIRVNYSHGTSLYHAGPKHEFIKELSDEIQRLNKELTQKAKDFSALVDENIKLRTPPVKKKGWFK